MAHTSRKSPSSDRAHTARRGRGRIHAVGGICLAAVWTVPVVRWVNGDVQAVLEILPELLFGTASFVVILLLWRSAVDAAHREALRIVALEDELEQQRAALREANERMVRRSQELDDEMSAVRARAERAEASNRRKSAFLAGTGDEIRRPVRTIVETAEARLAAGVDDTTADALRLVRRESTNLLDLIDEVLDFSEIEADRVELDDASYVLRTLVERSLLAVAARAHAVGDEVSCMIDPDLPRALRGDAGRVRQALVGLLNHAVKSTRDGSIRVRVERETGGDGVDRVRFEVTDDGDTPSPERLATLFHETGTPGPARGLGLVISAHLSRLMGGDAGAIARESGGTTLWFTVALRVGETHRLNRVETDVTGSRVLVVSESSATRLMCIQQLRECGCVPTASADGPSALAALRAAATAGDPFRLVVSELEVPGGTGLGFADVIAQEPTFGDPAVLVLVPLDDDRSARHVDAADDVLRLDKPVLSTELHDRLLQALRSAASETSVAEPEEDPVDRIAPAVQAAAERMQDEAGAEARPVRQGRVLVVDDNPVNRRVASLILKRAGYPVEVAEDGQIAVERIEAQPPYDLVLMDVHMPRLDGFEATARIRAMDESRARIPIVAMTASAMSGDADRCLEAGMDGYVSKPVKADALVRVVESWVPEEETVRDEDTGPDTGVDEDDGLATLDPSGIDELKALAGDDTSMLDELLGTFFETAEEHLRTMREASTAGDRGRLAYTAHGLRGSAGTIGAQRLHALCSELEDDARGTEGDLSGARIDRVERELVTVREALDRAFAPNGD